MTDAPRDIAEMQPPAPEPAEMQSRATEPAESPAEMQPPTAPSPEMQPPALASAESPAVQPPAATPAESPAESLSEAPTESPADAPAGGATIFAVANQKGGVGKTTTAVNLAACVAEAGYPTLLVDIDPQANATVGLGLSKHESPTVYDVLVGAATVDQAIHTASIDNLSVMPSTPDLAGANVELPRIAGSETILRDALEPLRERFRFIIFDCPPSLGPLTVNAMVAADRVIVPVQTEYFALEGLADLLDTVSLIQREMNPRLSIAGLVLTMHDGRTRLAEDVEAEVRKHFPGLIFDAVIPRNVRVAEAPSYGLPVTHHDPHCAGAGAYFELAKEVALRG